MKRPQDLACYGIERDDDDIRQTYPAEVKTGERYAEMSSSHTWEVFEWQDMTCSCVDLVPDPLQHYRLAPEADCRTCQGTGSELRPVMVGSLPHELARELVDGPRLREELARREHDLKHATNEAKGYVPDYPWHAEKEETASTIAWAIGQGYLGVS